MHTHMYSVGHVYYATLPLLVPIKAIDSEP